MQYQSSLHFMVFKTAFLFVHDPDGFIAAQAYSEAVVMTGMASSCFLYVSAAAWIRTLGPFCVGIEGLANDTVTSPCMDRKPGISVTFAFNLRAC